ncbi:glycoside hydrolase family 36 protein [Saliphagus sp. GCM10025317]
MDECAAGETTLRYDFDDRTLAVADGARRLLRADLEVVAESGRVVDLPIHARLEEQADGVAFSVAVENDGGESVTLESVVLECEVDGFGPESRIYEHGYQSWSPTATRSVGERFPDETPDNAPMMLDLKAPTDCRTSNYLTGFVAEERTLTMGYLEHEHYCTRFDIVDDADGIHRVEAVCPFEGRTIEPGETLDVPTLWIDANRGLEDALPTLADLVGAEMNARVPEQVPTGWCSWYHYFTDVTEDDVRENLAELQEWGIPVDLVQLDDGYMNAFGDWRTIDDDFSDMSTLAEDIDGAGYTPGLWLAPFYAEAGSNLFSDHPEWFVTDPDTGDPVDGGFRAGDRLYGLDTTHPEVQSWLRETFETVVDDWGFRYLKLDFLFAAALPGDRYDDEATRFEAYRQGLEIIDETVGRDVFVLGCGAPLAPSVGLVDAMRIGPDTDPVWETEGEAASQPALKNAVRNTLTRQFLHRRWWLNDPDCQLVRETSELTTAEREAFAALVATTGGVNVFSDRIAEIDSTGRRLLERSLPPAERGVVEGVAEDEFPDRVVCERPGDGATTVACFNWADEPRTVTLDPRRYADEPVAIWDGLDGCEIEASERIERTLPSHGVALYAVVESDAEESIVGSADTLTGGPV